MAATGLPHALRERLRSLSGISPPPPRAAESFPGVVYVLRTTFRASNNPAFEVALHMATLLDVPCTCLAVIEDSFPAAMQSGSITRHPTNRSACFRLEALRELQPLFAERGAPLYIHVERDGHRQAAAMSLASKAALVVTDEHYGVEPHASATAQVSRTGVPVWLVRAACPGYM